MEEMILRVNRAHRRAVSVYFFIAGLAFASWASRIPHIKAHLHLNEAQLGSILFALPVGLMTSLPLAGYFVSRLGSKRVMLTAAIVYPSVLVLIGLANSAWVLAVVLFFFGLWSNLFNIAMNTQAVGVEALYGRSVLASFHGLWSLAGFTGAAIGTFMVSQQIVPFTHFCIILAFAVALVLFSYQYTLNKDTGSNKDQPLFAKPDKEILKLGLVAFGSMVCEGTMFDWSGVYFQTVVKAPVALTTLGYVAFMGTMAGGRFLGDYMVTRFGVKNILQVSGIIIATGLLISVLFPFLIPATIGFLLVGIGVSSVVPLVYSLAGRSKTMLPSVALAAVSTIGFLGFLIGPPLIGFIAQLSSLRLSFTVIAVLGLATTFMAAQVKKE